MDSKTETDQLGDFDNQAGYSGGQRGGGLVLDIFRRKSQESLG